jgi:signal peptidase I
LEAVEIEEKSPMRAYDSIKAEREHKANLEAPDFLEQVRQLLSKNSLLEIRMSGSSMRPTIEDGDIITLEPITDNSIKPGDIVLYHSLRDTAVIHRVIRIERTSVSERSIITRGDAATQNDVPIPMHRVLARVKRVERAGEQVRVSAHRDKLRYRLLAWLHRFKFWSNR